MLRVLWYYLVLSVVTVFFTLATVLGALVGVRRRSYYDWCTGGWSRAILWGAGTRVLPEGLERVPPGGPVVYAANHTSMFDIFALSATLPGSVRFVAKQELARIPLFGRAMRAAGHVMIDRFNRAKAFQAYDRAAATIRSGVSAVVFPEGTRSRTGDLLPFKNAPFGLAIVAQVPLVPVYVHGTFQILPKGAWRLHRRPIRYVVGDPLPTVGLTLEDRASLRDRVREAIEGLRARVDVTPTDP